jgi:hypothetical protein
LTIWYYNFHDIFMFVCVCMGRGGELLFVFYNYNDWINTVGYQSIWACQYIYLFIFFKIQSTTFEDHWLSKQKIGTVPNSFWQNPPQNSCPFIYFIYLFIYLFIYFIFFFFAYKCTKYPLKINCFYHSHSLRYAFIIFCLQTTCTCMLHNAHFTLKLTQNHFTLHSCG